MGTLLVVLMLLAPGSRWQGNGQGDVATERTVRRTRDLILPTVDFDGTDAREALRWLFRQGRVGGTIAPDVRGTVTLSLRDVPWETALQSVVRQMDASYRIDHGFFEVVRREEEPQGGPSAVDPDLEAVRGAYGKIESAIARGDRARLLPAVEESLAVRKDGTSLSGASAVQAVVDTARAFPRFALDRPVDEWGRSASELVVRVSYSRGNGEAVSFRDAWRRSASGAWRLASRRPDRPETRRYEGVPLSQVLRAAFPDARVSWTLDPSLDRKVTLDLTGLPFDTAIQKLARSVGATYRIEGGVYRIVPGE